uniref:phosphatidylinositol 3-kinase n=1 Tax=Gouania willdenowi TaxID=441366 RepID=A0A8C5EQK4_GOUWI
MPGSRRSSVDQGYSGRLDCEPLTVTLPAHCSVYQLRLCICIEAQEQNIHPDPFAVLDPEKYSLLYTRGDELFEAYDDCQVIRTLDIPWLRDDSQCLSAHLLVKPVVAADPEEMRRQQQCLSELIGYDLEREVSNRLGELMFTRRKLASPRRLELRNRNDTLYATEPWITTAPLSEDLQDWLKRTFCVNLHYIKVISLSMQANLTDTPEALLEVFRSAMKEQELKYDASESFVLKVTGREEFLSGEHSLQQFFWVRQCLKANQDLHLTVVPVSQLPPETVTSVDWPLVDGFSGNFSSHDDLSLEGKDLDDIFMISLWDCDRRFRVKLIGFDIPTLPNKCPQSVYVEATILYGSKVFYSVSSSPKAFADELLWNEWLEFDVLLRDLPRGAKLGLTIVTSAGGDPKLAPSTSSRRSTEQQKVKGKVLYFVNLLLIDHRSILSQGLHTLHMWSYPESGEGSVTYQADKLSSTTNPDTSKSMAISFLLDCYSFPVVFPNHLKFTDSSGAPSHTTPGTSPTLSARYVSSLPEYLRRIDWMNYKAVDDVHWLLSKWNPMELDICVALELLSTDFPDEVVRKLAVQRLDILSNDDVLKYLLQLVQTLKVETYHDSFLARFLIQRALRSKRIGHFFFWYIRSEVAGCLYFRQRMAVILEAFLLGCGQAMLDGLTLQVQAVETLHKVALDIKALFPDKSDLSYTASQKLQELLRQVRLPAEFLLPFDPRIKAGTILIDKCKVMASKKKPLWLEFSPMASPTLTTPVGIIFKHGDDLRQDMLVIQVLVLMDSIWQEKSLDLNLVPYGCISTGLNAGMIEIVRNAVTIAMIQRNNGGSAGAFKNDALFEWLKSKGPLQEIHFTTVEKFVKSCAGYCVATYVLGIGDRHNDNIMVTDQGNMFHIDFGHILGNRKKFIGQSREYGPFVLTPDFVYVMGRDKGCNSLSFRRFRDTCTQAYLSLRSHSRLLVTLFSLMMLTGIPELSADKDMRYLREVLHEEQTEEAAKEHFLKQISLCLENGWKVQTNFWVHLIGESHSR